MTDDLTLPNSDQRANVLGVGISPLTIPLAAERVFEAAQDSGFSGFVTITGVHGVMESQRDEELQRIHNRSFLSTPDGMPMVWMARWHGYRFCERVYGPDLMLEVFRRSAEGSESHYLFGGGEGVAECLAQKLRQRFPAVRIAGINSPPFRPLTAQEEDELAADLRAKRPHFFWVGLSTPKQERFMHGFLAKYPDLTKGWDHGLVMFGVGAAFDFHAGLVRQAPGWMQRSGLEWFFRLAVEPRRLWKRYAVIVPGFIGRIVPQMTGRKAYPLKK